MKVPRQCPLILLVKVDLVSVRCLEVEKVKRRKVEKGDKLSRVLLLEVEARLNNI
jgi:hypothetical protein